MKAQILGFIKRLSIDLGLYRVARQISRKIRKAEQVRFERSLLFYKRLLGPQPLLCFDVGANIGEKSEVLLALGHKVVSFEPNDDLAPELRSRCGVYAEWDYCPTALGATPSLARLHVKDYIGQASLLPNWGAGSIRASKCTPIVTLDIVTNHFGVPSFLKIDVEGYELEVINGLNSPIPLIVFELHLSEPGIKSARLCLDKIRAMADYEVNLCDGESLELLWEAWQPIEQFANELTDPTSVSGFKSSYGDIYCRQRIHAP